MGKGPCCPKEGMNKGAWTAIEDQILKAYIKVHGEGKWGSIPKRAGLKRCGKSCRLRWLNYLRPNIKRGNITPDEDDLIIRLHNLLGNRWSLIAGRLPGRTDNEIKNYWNTNLSKRAKSKQPKNITKSEKKVRTKPSNPAPVISCEVQAKAEDSNNSALVTPQVHQLPNHYKFQVDNNLETTATILPSQSKSDRMQSLTSKEEETSSEFMVDYYMGDTSISELLGSDFTGQAFLAPEKNNWGTSSDQFNKDHMDADFGFLASLMVSSDQDWIV